MGYECGIDRETGALAALRIFYCERLCTLSRSN